MSAAEITDPSCVWTGGLVMNASLLTADRNTHFKIVAMGLSAALITALLTLAMH